MSAPLWVIDPSTHSRELAVSIAQARGIPVFAAFDPPTAWRLFRISRTPRLILFGADAPYSQPWGRWQKERESRLGSLPCEAVQSWSDSQLEQLQELLQSRFQNWLIQSSHRKYVKYMK